MPVIKFENGVSVNVEGNPTQKDIDEIASKIGINKTQEINEQPSLWGKIKSDFSSRWNEAKNNAQELKKGNINIPEYIARNAGQGAGALTDTLADVAMPVVKPLAKGVWNLSPAGMAYNNLPDEVKSAINENIGNGIKKGSEIYNKIPERYRKDAEGVINILSVLPEAKLSELGIKGTGKTSKLLGNIFEESGIAGKEANKLKLAEDIVKPLETKAVKESQVARTSEKGYGIFKRSVIEPTDIEKQAASEIAKIPEINASNTMQQNYNIIRDNVVSQAKNLEKAISDNQFIISKKEVISKLERAASELSNNPLITGDAEKTANKLIEGAKKFINENPGNGSGVLSARKKYDSWIKSLKPKAFDAKAENAFTIANRAVRSTLNDILDSKATAVGVKDALKKQSLLYTAMENITPKAAKEANTAIGRLIQKSSEILGTKNKIVQGAAAAIGIGGLGAAATFAPAVAAIGGTGLVAYKAGKLIMKPEVREFIGKLLSKVGNALDPEDIKVLNQITGKEEPEKSLKSMLSKLGRK